MHIPNRKIKYEIIKKIINNASPELLKVLISYYGFEYKSVDDIKNIKQQLLNYLNELQIHWEEYKVDMTDRQYIKIYEK